MHVDEQSSRKMKKGRCLQYITSAPYQTFVIDTYLIMLNLSMIDHVLFNVLAKMFHHSHDFVIIRYVPRDLWR